MPLSNYVVPGNPTGAVKLPFKKRIILIHSVIALTSNEREIYEIKLFLWVTAGILRDVPGH